MEVEEAVMELAMEEEEVIMEGIMEAVEGRLGLRVGQVTVMEVCMSMVLEE